MRAVTKLLVAVVAVAAVIVAASGVTSCEKYFLPSLVLSQDTILVNKAPQELSLVINSNVEWSVELGEVNAKWLDVTPDYGEATATVKITISGNDSGEKRSVNVPIRSETLERDLLIVQSKDGELPQI
ncbi:MAG: BACON domain-containing protein [Bacteroidales bacterium]|nr:BACON domain-containing protein [Bacteroidales bacterium]